VGSAVYILAGHLLLKREPDQKKKIAHYIKMSLSDLLTYRNIKVIIHQNLLGRMHITVKDV